MSIQNLGPAPTCAADYLALAQSLEKKAEHAMNPSRKAFQAAARYAREKAAKDSSQTGMKKAH